MLDLQRIQDYREVITIWADNVAKYPSSARGHNNLAWALQREGRSDGGPNCEALVDYCRRNPAPINVMQSFLTDDVFDALMKEVSSGNDESP